MGSFSRVVILKMLIICTFPLFSTFSNAALYKCDDGNGGVLYSSSHCEGGIEFTHGGKPVITSPTTSAKQQQKTVKPPQHYVSAKEMQELKYWAEYKWFAPCDTIREASIGELLRTSNTLIRGLTDNEYQNAECHLFDETYLKTIPVKRWTLKVMRYGNDQQANAAKNILEKMMFYESKTIGQPFKRFSIPKHDINAIKQHILSIREGIAHKTFRLPDYIETPHFWSKYSS